MLVRFITSPIICGICLLSIPVFGYLSDNSWFYKVVATNPKSDLSDQQIFEMVEVFSTLQEKLADAFELPAPITLQTELESFRFEYELKENKILAAYQLPAPVHLPSFFGAVQNHNSNY